MNYFRVLLVLILLAICLSCGKYGKPHSPEYFAPSEVLDLAVSASVQGVTFDWRAPQTNQRAKKLKDLEGYRVYRREIELNSSLSDPNAKFDLIATVQDTHLQELLELKKQVGEQGQSTNKVELDQAEERSKFQYVDRSVVPGRHYYYQIVPINQGGIEGRVATRIDILFRGEISEIARIPFAAEDFEF